MSKSLLSLSGQVEPRNFVPTGWSCFQLDNVSEIFGGGRLGFTKEKHYQSSGVLAFSAAGPDGFVEHAEVIDQDGVVLSAIGANCGRCFYATGNWTTLANIQVILPRNALNAKYLYYYVNRDGYWERSGSAQPFIKPSSIRTSWVVFPTSKPEQTKIAEVLSTVDRAIEQTEAIIAKQQRIKTGLMQDLLTRGIDEQGNIRSEETHEFKDSPLGRIPVEWEVHDLDNCVEASAPICYGILMPGYVYDGGVPVVKVKDIIDGVILLDDLLPTDPKIDKQYKRSRIKVGDLLLTIRGTTGRIASVPEELSGANITQDTARIRLKADYSKVFFYSLLQSNYVQDQILLHTLGQAVKGINIAEVRRLTLAIPPLPEQEEIAKYLGQITKSLRNLKAELDKLRLQKQGLMQDLLTGRVRVTPLLTEAQEMSS